LSVEFIFHFILQTSLWPTQACVTIPYIQHLFGIFFLYGDYVITYKEYPVKSRAGFSQCVVTRPRFGRARNCPFSGTRAVGPIQPFIWWVPEALLIHGASAPRYLLGPHLRRWLVTSASVSRYFSSRRLCC